MTRMLVGMETKRREKYFSYFSFDAATYRGWMKHANVWLKPDDTDGHADSDNTDDGNNENHVFTFSPVFTTFPPEKGKK